MNQKFLADINLRDHLELTDFIIILLSILAFFLVSHFSTKKFKKNSNSDQDFLLMSKRLSLPLFVATLTSTWYGGIFGVTQIAFNKGIYNFFTQGLFWYLSYAIFAIFFVKQIRKSQAYSLPELLGAKFGDRARAASGLILFFHALPVTYSLSAAILLHLILGFSIFQSLIICVSVVALYSAFGGFRGVVFSNALQFILMFSSLILLVGFLIYNFGLHPFLQDNLPATHWQWRGGISASSALIWLFIACTSTLTHPVFYQTCLAAKSDKVAIKGLFIAIGFWFISDICTTLSGMYARAILPDADSYKAYLFLGVQLLPIGLKGLFVVGIISTIFSTMDSFLFVSGTSVSYDMLKNRPHNRAIYHRLAIIFSAFILIFLTSFFGTNFEDTWLFLEGMLSSATFLPVLVAVFYKKPLPAFCFFVPSISALTIFCSATFLGLGQEIIQPFYAAHLGAMLTFLVCLYARSKREAKVAVFSNA